MNREEDLLVAERAAEWLERMKAPEPHERAAFSNWLKESPRNAREILLAMAWDVALDQMDPNHEIDLDELMARMSANVVPVRRDSDLANSRHQAHPIGWSPLGWSLTGWSLTGWSRTVGFGVIATVFVAVFLGWSGIAQRLLNPNQFETAVGEQRAIELGDGSVIHLNTQSQVRVAFSEKARDVYLNVGQAIFKVKHDATRPFRVHVGHAIVQAIGTQFDVHRLADRTNVAVIDGVVQIIADDSNVKMSLTQLSERTRIAAGKAVSIIADGQITPPAVVNVVEMNAWQQRRLIFRRNTLLEIADEFNRYNKSPQIRVVGDELQARKFSGVFDADDPESLLMYLTSDSQLAFDRQGDEFVISIREGTQE